MTERAEAVDVLLLLVLVMLSVLCLTAFVTDLEKIILDTVRLLS